jgi:hypothetical protein
MEMNRNNRTGLGLSDCKKALEKCDGDIKKATDKLPTIGLAKADKTFDKIALDWLVAMHLAENRGVLIELKHLNKEIQLLLLLFSMFSVCSSSKNCPSARCASAANVVCRDVDISGTKPLSLKHIL